MKYFLLALLGFSSFQLLSQESGSDSYIQVQGTASHSIRATAMQMSVTVEGRAEEPREAQQQVLEKSKTALRYMNGKEYLEQVNSERLQLNVQNQYNDRDIECYARQQITFKLNDITQYESFILGLIDAGVTQYHTLGYVLEDREKLEMRIMAEALENARQKAELLAKRAEKQLGEVLIISDQSGDIGGPQPFRDGLKLSSEAQQVLGETQIQISQSIQVRFALK